MGARRPRYKEGTYDKQVPTRFDTAQAPQGLVQCNNITTKGTSSINIATNNLSTKALRASCNTAKAAWQALSNQQQSKPQG
ncbi:hypothetical protein Tco_1037112 [Tanacetum coccineum]